MPVVLVVEKGAHVGWKALHWSRVSVHRVYVEFIGPYRNTDKFSTQSHILLPQNLLNGNLSSTHAEIHVPAISSHFNLKCNNRLWKVCITQNRLAYVEINRSAFQIFEKGIWYLRNGNLKFMSVSQMTKAFQNGNGCSLCNGWNVNLTLLLVCTFEQKGNKRGPAGCSSTMINYNLYNPPQDRVTNLLMFCKDFLLRAECFCETRRQKNASYTSAIRPL
jgi:hypothetical protein